MKPVIVECDRTPCAAFSPWISPPLRAEMVAIRRNRRGPAQLRRGARRDQRIDLAIR